MNPQNDVASFHAACGVPIGDTPHMLPNDRQALRETLHYEEFLEIYRARTKGVAAYTKEICDKIYVLLGTLVEMGVDFESAWQAVHESNMQKSTGPKRADGKVLKPEGWQEPDMEKAIKPFIKQ